MTKPAVLIVWWAIFIMRLIATTFVVWRRAVFIMVWKTWRAVLVVMMVWLVLLMRDVGRVVPNIWVLVVVIWLRLVVRAFRVMVGSHLRLLVGAHGWRVAQRWVSKLVAWVPISYSGCIGIWCVNRYGP